MISTREVTNGCNPTVQWKLRTVMRAGMMATWLALMELQFHKIEVSSKGSLFLESTTRLQLAPKNRAHCTTKQVL